MSEQTYRQILGDQFKATWPELDTAERVAMRTVWFRPLKRKKLEMFMFNQAQVEGFIPEDASIDDVPPQTVGSPDWAAFFSSLGDFLAKIAPIFFQLLPLILKKA
jgi:hypothetical protein